MNRGGAAYIAYRVLVREPAPQDPNAPPGYFGGEVRVARYNGWLWSALGAAGGPQPERARSPRRPPRTRPKVGIDVSGNGIVAFHEPDDDFVDRVWARRIFGSTFGIPLIVSPQQFGGRAAARAGRRVLARRDGLRAGRGGAAPAAGAAGRRADRAARVREPDPGVLQRRGGQVRAARGSPTAPREGRSAAAPARRPRASRPTAASSRRSGSAPPRAPRRAATRRSPRRSRWATGAAPSPPNPVVEVARDRGVGGRLDGAPVAWSASRSRARTARSP